MKHHHLLLVLMVVCLLAAPAAANVSDSSVTNTNLYAGSYVYDIAPPANVTTSSATGISNVAGRYIYASALDNSVSERTATLILMDRQGATVNVIDSTVVSGISVDWGDGSTSDSLTHEYAADGIYNVTATVTNYLDNTGITLTDRVQIGATSISISVSPAVLTTGKSWTLTADAVVADTVQWQISRNNASWTNIPAGTYTPSEYGIYFFRAIAYGADGAVYSNVERTTYQYVVSVSTVVNTNVYAGSDVFDIAPSGYYDTASSASGITNVAGRYIYASSLSASTTGATAAYTLEGRQGSTTVEAPAGSIGTAQSWAWAFGDGQTATTLQNTTHNYSAPGTYTTSLTLKNYLDSTGITVSTAPFNILPIAPTINASTSTAQLGLPVTLTATGILYTSLQWQYSTDGGTTWQDITGATTSPYNWTPVAGQYSIRALVSDSITGYTATSNTVSLSVYAPPTITAVSVSPEIGQYTETITLAAEVTDTGITPTTYQWQQSPAGQNTWTNIPGATTALWVGQLTVSGKTDFRLQATGTGGTTNSSTVTYYVAPPGELRSVAATPSVVALPGSTKLSASGTNILSYEWQRQESGSWTTIGYGATLTEALSDVGTYNYRVVATGADGNTVTSDAITVLAGYAPTVEITSPVEGTQYQTNTQITAQATITGTDVIYKWGFGNTGLGDTQANPTNVTYTQDGYKTITLRAESIFGTATDSVTFLYGKDPRPMQTELFDTVNTTLVDNLIAQFDVPLGEMPNPVGIIGSLFQPFDDALKGFFWVLVFGAIMLVVWLITKSVALPSVLGILFGSFMVGFMPDMYIYPAVALIAAGCAGGLLYVIRKN